MSPRSLSRLAVYPGVEKGARYRPTGKTLIELLVVIAIIAALLGLLLPAALEAWKAVNRLK